MLNIGRMKPGGEDYYLQQVTRSVNDGYYVRTGEAPGRWLGRSVELAGIDGSKDVTADALRAVLGGRHATTGAQLASHPARKVPGFDLAFRAPKSVSLLWGLGSLEVADQVRAAHDAAVAAAVGYLEREALRTRRGAGGVERVETDGFVAAAFRHRTSRANDPLLHTHVLAANLVRTTDDGVWRTIESRRLYLHAKTAGTLYQAHLRAEITRRLGVAWGPVVNGTADIAGVPRQLIDAFSTRRRQILEHLDDRGLSSAKAAQVATLETRQGKGHDRSEEDLRREWAQRARELGFDPMLLDQLVGRARQPQGPDVAALARELIGEEALTQDAATFCRRDLLQAIANRLPDGATVEQLEATADAVVTAGRDELITLGTRRGQLAAVDVIRTGDGRIVDGGDDRPRMTTRRLLATEQAAIEHALGRRDDGSAYVDDTILQRVLEARPTMSGEQADMVRRLCQYGDGVSVVVGRAGTGKTFALHAARQAWAEAGIDVHGVALAARAARELEDTAGIPSMTIHRLLAIAEGGRGLPMRPGSVLVVDEAGMVGTRTLARLLEVADRQQLKVVLVGDPRQLPEIDAGGLFAALAARLDTIELTHNRRQAHRWEQATLDQLRHGDTDTALADYRRHGRLMTADDAETLREQLVADWWDTYDQHGTTTSIMIALRQRDVDDLNARARLRMQAAGHLTGDPVDIGGVQVQAGDRIVCLRNNRRLDIDNGTTATIVRLEPDGAMAIVDDAGRQIELPRWYAANGHLTHGYAITGHKAQGMTVDHSFVLGSDALYREWGYVAMSRGRHTNRLYTHAPDDHDAIDHHGVHQPGADELTAAGLRRSKAQSAAVTHLPTALDDTHVQELAAQWRDLHRHLTDASETRRRLTDRRDQLAGKLERLDRRIDRHETERAELSRGLGRLRRDTRDRITQLERAIVSDEQDRSRLTRELENVHADLARQPGQALLAGARSALAGTEADLAPVIEVRIIAALADPPRYILARLGAEPPDSQDQPAWQRAVEAIEAYRTRWSITDPDRPLGELPDDTTDHLQLHERVNVLRTIRDAVTQEPELDPPVLQQVLHRGFSR